MPVVKEFKPVNSNSKKNMPVKESEAEEDKPKLDPNDPRVKKLVYSMYRDMLTSYNGDANRLIEQKDPSQVRIDYGINPILETIIIRGGSGPQIVVGGGSDSLESTSSTGGLTPSAPPPPPMAPPGAIPAVRLNSELGHQHQNKGPPAALANAMMKDKKPFTYTPGGIDLSEIKSPRMAKRLQMNAAAEGVTSVPTMQPNHPNNVNPQSHPHHHLPPAALAAMQPQMAISVFPQGGLNPNQHLTRTPKPSDFTDGSHNGNNGHSHGPPPPPDFRQMIQHQNQNQQPPPPPPPPERSVLPVPVSGQPAAMSLSSQAFKQELEAVAARRSPVPLNLGNEDNPNLGSNVGQGSIYIRPISPAPTQQQHQQQQQSSSIQQDRQTHQVSAPQPQQYLNQLQQQEQSQSQVSPPPVVEKRSISPRPGLKAQSQNLGSIYIPPIEQQNQIIMQSQQKPQSQQMYMVSTTPGSATTPSQTPIHQTPGNVRIIMMSPPGSPQAHPPQTPPTPQLNKAPTPWMNSYNKMASKQVESPPYVNPGNVMTPWGTLTQASSPSSPQVIQIQSQNQAQGGGSGVVRTIPISIQREDNERPTQTQAQQIHGQQMQMEHQQGINRAIAAQHLGRAIPIQIQRQQSQEGGGGRSIPIQIEGRQGSTNSGGSTPTTPGGTSGVRRVMGPSSGFNNPMGLYSNQNINDAFQQQQGEVMNLMQGMQNMSIGGPRMEPIQSKSMRVIQQAAENVDEGNYLHNTTEPRFRGGHNPSKAFKALQSTLPPTASEAQEKTKQTQQSYPGQQQGPVTHNIQILMTPQSPTPQQQQQQQNLPPSEQKVPEPKKYMGSNIPSRSFKILQAMTAEDGADPSEESDTSSPNAAAAAASLSAIENPSSVSNCSSSLSLSSSLDTCPETELHSPEWFPEGQMDPYSCMSWYYWWYYVSCYWSGYDMTGYEYPEGWDPNYPYFPPEFYAYCNSNPTTDVEMSLNDNSYVKVDLDLNNASYDYNEKEDARLSGNEPQIKVPKIVIEVTPSLNESLINEKKNDCCDKNLNSKEEVEVEEECYWSCDESQKISEKDDKFGWVSSNDSNKARLSDSEEDEETEPEDCVDGSDIVGIIEEPETPTSEDSDTGTIVVDEFCSGNLRIEEYLSSSESEMNKRKLSRIEELSERSSVFSSSSSSSSGLIQDQKIRKQLEELLTEEGLEDEEEDEEISTEEDDGSSVSVIENKSDATRACSESKREDWTTSSESEESEDSKEEEEEVEKDDDEDLGADTAVTVRLPLKLSFGKTKSYKDITTVLVGEVDQSDDNDNKECEEDVKEYSVVQDDQYMDEDEDDEPVVSFTISLSRQHSKEEDVVVNKVKEQTNTAPTIAQDIDFWGQIISEPEVKPKQKVVKEYFSGSEDFWGISDEAKDDKAEEEPVVVILRNKPIDFHIQRPYSHTEGMLTKGNFNFWDKSFKTIESRRFSGNFEISEDYESDSGMKSDTALIEEQRQKQKVKRFTHTHGQQKRLSIPAGLPICVRGIPFNKRVGAKEEQVCEFWKDQDEDPLKPELNHQEIRQEEEINPEEGISPEEEINPEEDISPEERNESDDSAEKGKPSEIHKSETMDFSAGWSYWDEIQNENNNTKPNSPNLRIEAVDDYGEEKEAEEQAGEEAEDKEILELDEIKVSVEIKLPVPKPLSTSEISGNSEEFSDCAEGDEENEESEEEEEEIIIAEEDDQNKTDNETNKSEKPEETHSDGSSSKSSGTTIQPIEIDHEPLVESEEPCKTVTFKEIQESSIREESTERSIEIHEIGENIKLRNRGSCGFRGQSCPREEDESSCTCHIGDRMARAESLLWRIERFLHESLSLGSEDDSGVMTDLSRQISDVDTDADNDLNDTEFLLTAAAAASKERRSNTTIASPNKSPQVVRRRPKSEILVVTSEKSTMLVEETKINSEGEIGGGVKMRTTAAERKALRYQRAKTHSRLFQLLQDECGKEDEDEEDDDAEAYESCAEFEINTRKITKTPVNFTDLECNNSNNVEISKPINEPINVDTCSNSNTTTTTAIISGSGQRSRLMPLPLKNIMCSGLGLSVDSNSSPSGSTSSGVLSPTSPVTKDQLLADIINEFHLRNKETFTSTTSFEKSRKRFSKFPSKIFKLLQQEFGEEFYQTFDCGNGERISGDDSLPASSTSLTEIVHECTIHKSESLKALEELFSQSQNTMNTAKREKEREDSKQTTPDFLEVPLRRKLFSSNKSISSNPTQVGHKTTRDFRSPKKSLKQ